MTGLTTPADQQVVWETVDECPLCGRSDLRPWRSGCKDSSALVSRTLDYLVCSGCRTRVLSPRPSGSTVGALYGAGYAPYVRRRTDPSVLVGGSGGGPLQARLAAVYLHAPQGRRVLDFGCGTSEFLDAARAAGWSTTGCDFSDEGVAGTRAAGHETRVLDDSFWDWLRGQRFDAIRLNHVIEHLHYPGTQLRDLMQSLRPGGLLHIVTPDPEGPACRLFRRSSLFFEAVHLTLIPPGALAAAAVAAGASAVDVVHEQGTKDLWRSWQLSRGQVENYAAARPEPGHRGQRLALKALARVTRRSDRYHAFVRA